MGALVSRALRPLKSFNIENRAHRLISKEKPVPAPKYTTNMEDLKRAFEVDPALDEKLDKKDPGLDERLKEVYVTSFGRPEDDVTRERQEQKEQNRLLPQDRSQVVAYEFGFKEPERIPYGRTTLRQSIEFMTVHQADPAEVPAAKIALEYKLKEEDVEKILKYYKTFEIYVPQTKQSAAVFAGPAMLKKQLEDAKAREMEEKKLRIESNEDKKESSVKGAG